jgi:DNA-binding transcriptional ArsR family regulator
MQDANHRQRDSFNGEGVDPGHALTGTTLLVYRYLVTSDKPAGAREVQRELKLSGPSVASFHLEKLARNGLVRKNEVEGTYSVDRIYLKHFILLRRRLIPRYSFYAALATMTIGGWLTAFFLGGSRAPVFSSQASFYVFVYGVSLSILFSAIFWYETLLVLRNEKI